MILFDIRLRGLAQCSVQRRVETFYPSTQRAHHFISPTKDDDTCHELNDGVQSLVAHQQHTFPSARCSVKNLLVDSKNFSNAM
mmetsp:Transcript_10395/g.23147  ORF Transcript_10395/g.23147 Transcript_10395/m.23147 type:complete len:83 (+) Transcript_10395:79-327(+)